MVVHDIVLCSRSVGWTVRPQPNFLRNVVATVVCSTYLLLTSLCTYGTYVRLVSYVPGSRTTVTVTSVNVGRYGRDRTEGRTAERLTTLTTVTGLVYGYREPVNPGTVTVKRNRVKRAVTRVPGFRGFGVPG